MLNSHDHLDEGEFIEYLAQNRITDIERKTNSKGETEIYFPCPFNGCDDDRRRGEEGHCSYNLDKGVYNCFKCKEKGNFVTLQKHFGDYQAKTVTQAPKKKKREASLDTITRKAFERDPEYVKKYFNARGINDDSIRKYKLGIGEFYGHKMFVIPINDRNGNIAYLKLRRTPEDERIADAMQKDSVVQKYMKYPTGSETLLVGEDELVKSSSSDVLICEGELDRITAIQNGVKMPVVSGGGGAQTFKDEWLDSLRSMRNIYICMDRDKTGESGVGKLAQRIAERIPNASVFKIALPYPEDSKADLSNYFEDEKGTTDELFSKYAEFYAGAQPIDASKFKELTVNDIADILDLTIKKNRINKVITFLAMLLAYTEDSQLNVMFNAQSSSGKTYITTEVSNYFPQQDVKVYGRTSKTAFYYNESLMKTDEKGRPFIDLERRILVFAEQPDMQLLENLRSFLSHDMKMTPYIITNKSKNGRNTARESYLRGFSTVLFCSANLRIDEQEQTRCLLLSPESTEETVRAGVDLSISRNSDKKAYIEQLNSNENRRQLMDRILYIKSLNVDQIDIDDSDYLRKRFYEKRRSVPPRTQREIGHFISLVKGLALVNAPFRTKNGKIIASNKDIDEAMKLWAGISESMFYGVPPQALDYYKKYILPAYTKANEGRAKKKGVTYDQIAAEYFKQTGSYPNLDMVRKMIIPALQCATLISYDKDEDDRRQMLVTPLITIGGELEKSDEK